MHFKNFKPFLFFISLTYFTVTKCGNLSLNILKLFRQKKKRKKKRRLSQKSSCKFFCKMKYLSYKTTELDNLQMMESLTTVFVYLYSSS